MNQQPFGELETRPLITPESRRVTEQKQTEMSHTWHSVITREKTGRISGLTDVIYIPSKPYKIVQELTGVREQY